jgi:hypothetical protein
VIPITRDRSLAMARCRCRPQYMAKWLDDHVAAVGYFNTQHIVLVVGTWLNWRPSGDLRWKVETAGWEGQGVVCDKPAPPRL